MTEVDNEEFFGCVILGELVKRYRLGVLYVSVIQSVDENVTDF